MPSAPREYSTVPTHSSPSHLFAFAQNVTLLVNAGTTPLPGKLLILPALAQLCLLTHHPGCPEWITAQTRGSNHLGSVSAPPVTKSETVGEQL